MKKDNNQNFDNYIRKALAEDPIVPTGLDWGSMDIEIPQKKNRKPLIFFIIGFVLIIGIFFSGYYFNEYSSQNETLSSDIIAESRINNNLMGSKSEIKIDEPIGINDDVRSSNNGINKTLSKDGVFEDSKSLELIETSYNTNSVNRSIVASDEINFNAQSGDVTKQKPIPTIQLSSVSNQDVGNDTDDNNNNKDNEATSNSSDVDLELVSLSVPLLPLFNPKSLIVGNKIMSSPNKIAIDLGNYSKSNNEIYLKLGMNIGSFNLADGSELNDKLANVLGRSLHLGYRRIIGNNFILNTSIDYNESHTVFQHSEEVRRQVSLMGQSQIITCQHTYQNNYSKTIGVSVGLGYRLGISNNFEIQTNINLNSNKLISLSGLTLSKDEVVNLNDLQYGRRIDLNIAPSVELRYSINDNFGIQLSYIYNRTISNGIDLGNNVRRNSMSQFLSGIYMTF